VIKPGETSHLPNIWVEPLYLLEESPKFRAAFREAVFGERACLPVALFRHEVEAHRPLRIRRIVREAAIREGTPHGSAVVGCQCNTQKVGMSRAAPNFVQERGPSGFSRSSPQSKATAQVGAAGDRLLERCTGELGMPRGKAKLKVEIVFKQAVAGHLPIISAQERAQLFVENARRIYRNAASRPGQQGRKR
jgi:hypothetical protein